MKCHFPVAEIDGVTIAVLLVETDKQHLGLILHPAEDIELQDPSRRMYYTTWSFEKGQSFDQCRLAHLGDDLYNLRFRGKPLNATWRDVYIHAFPRTSDDQADPGHLVLHFAPDRAPTRGRARDPAPFRVPRWLVGALFNLQMQPRTGAVLDSTTSTETWVEFTNYSTSEKIRLQFGVCTSETSGARHHWAWADNRSLSTWTRPWGKRGHDCATDHIDSWPDATRAFGDEERTIRLSFARCVHSPQHTRVVHLELKGRVYEEMQRNANFSIASRSLDSLTTTEPRPSKRTVQVIPPEPLGDDSQSLKSDRPSYKPSVESSQDHATKVSSSNVLSRVRGACRRLRRTVKNGSDGSEKHGSDGSEKHVELRRSLEHH